MSWGVNIACTWRFYMCLLHLGDMDTYTIYILYCKRMTCWCGTAVLFLSVPRMNLPFSKRGSSCVFALLRALSLHAVDIFCSFSRLQPHVL